MKELIKKFSLVGECEIDVSAVTKAWDDKSCILTYDDGDNGVKYTLLKYTRNRKHRLKVQIPKEQAMQLVTNLGLNFERHDFLKKCGQFSLPAQPK